MRTSVLRFAVVLAPLFGVACTTSTSSDVPDADGGACAASGSGNVTVMVAGLPEGLAADVSIEGGAGGARAVVPNEAFVAEGGSYRVSANVVAGSDPIVRTAYAASIDGADFCLTNGSAQTVTVTYAPIATSGKLWHTNQNAAAQLLGFASSSLAETGAPAATVAGKGGLGRSLAFDREGNLWSHGGTTTDATLARYSAASLAASGDKRPDVELRFDPGQGCIPGISSIAFAGDGALWATSGCAKKALRLAPEDIRASGEPAPNVNLGGLDGPEGLAFDKDGNLWVANTGAKTLVRFDAARLGASSDEIASLVIAPKTETAVELAPNHLAFDKDGNLWIASFSANTIYRLTPSELEGAGTKDVTPAVRISLSVNALPEGLAFDESGALWLTLAKGQIGRLGASQLGASSTPGAPTTPEVIVSSPDINFAHAPTFFPAAKGTPLYAALP
ncbi:MAG: hypothetical protein KIT84_04790 [Labilithrix sp.]|nr:hypothetical protein [Labilithrix sp.]MCW5810303.1 hypothetical protein [Labilithrix sp.]